MLTGKSIDFPSPHEFHASCFMQINSLYSTDINIPLKDGVKDSSIGLCAKLKCCRCH